MTLFVVTDLAITPQSVTARTNVPVTLSLRATRFPPTRTPRYKRLRGRDYPCGYTLNWPPDLCIQPTEAQPSTVHTFPIPTLTPPMPLTAALVESTNCTLPNPSTPPFDIPAGPPPTGPFHAIIRLSADNPNGGAGPGPIPMDVLYFTDDPLGLFQTAGYSWKPNRQGVFNATCTYQVAYTYAAGAINTYTWSTLLPLFADSLHPTLAPPSAPGTITNTHTMSNLWQPHSFTNNGVSMLFTSFRTPSTILRELNGFFTQMDVTYTPV